MNLFSSCIGCTSESRPSKPATDVQDNSFLTVNNEDPADLASSAIKSFSPLPFHPSEDKPDICAVDLTPWDSPRQCLVDTNTLEDMKEPIWTQRMHHLQLTYTLTSLISASYHEGENTSRSYFHQRKNYFFLSSHQTAAVHPQRSQVMCLEIFNTLQLSCMDTEASPSQRFNHIAGCR